MDILQIVKDYVIPIVGGVFVLFFLSLILYGIHRVILKPLNVYGWIKNKRISFREKKLLEDEKVIAYCVARIEREWKEADVRKELLLTNSYSSQRIDEMVYAFNAIKKEMQAEPVAEDLP